MISSPLRKKIPKKVFTALSSRGVPAYENSVNGLTPHPASSCSYKQPKALQLVASCTVSARIDIPFARSATIRLLTMMCYSVMTQAYSEKEIPSSKYRLILVSASAFMWTGLTSPLPCWDKLRPILCQVSFTCTRHEHGIRRELAKPARKRARGLVLPHRWNEIRGFCV